MLGSEELGLGELGLGSRIVTPTPRPPPFSKLPTPTSLHTSNRSCVKSSSRQVCSRQIVMYPQPNILPHTLTHSSTPPTLLPHLPLPSPHPNTLFQTYPNTSLTYLQTSKHFPTSLLILQHAFPTPIPTFSHTSLNTFPHLPQHFLTPLHTLPIPPNALSHISPTFFLPLPLFFTSPTTQHTPPHLSYFPPHTFPLFLTFPPPVFACLHTPTHFLTPPSHFPLLLHLASPFQQPNTLPTPLFTSPHTPPHFPAPTPRFPTHSISPHTLLYTSPTFTPPPHSPIPSSTHPTPFHIKRMQRTL